MASGPPFVSLGNPARFVNESGESQIARIGTTLKESDDGGATWAGIGGGGFGANTTVQLPNNLSVNVNALNLRRR